MTAAIKQVDHDCCGSNQILDPIGLCQGLLKGSRYFSRSTAPPSLSLCKMLPASVRNNLSEIPLEITLRRQAVVKTGGILRIRYHLGMSDSQ